MGIKKFLKSWMRTKTRLGTRTTWPCQGEKPSIWISSLTLLDLDRRKDLDLPPLTFNKITPLLSWNLVAGWAAAHRPLEVPPMRCLTTPTTCGSCEWHLNSIHFTCNMNLSRSNRILRIVSRVTELGERCSSGPAG